jgi:hypothetical protein
VYLNYDVSCVLLIFIMTYLQRGGSDRMTVLRDLLLLHSSCQGLHVTFITFRPVGEVRIHMFVHWVVVNGNTVTWQ